MAENIKTLSFKKRWGIPLAILAMAITYTFPMAGLSMEGKHALVLFAGVFILFLSEPIPIVVSSLLIVPAAVLLKVCSLKMALSGFSSSSSYLLVGAFIMAVALTKTRLAERITFLILKVTGSSVRNLTLGVTIANIVLAFFIPSSTPRVAILLPICLNLIALFKEEGRTKFAVNLLLTMSFTNSTISGGILTANLPNPITVEFIHNAGGPMISYLDFLIVGFPPALLMTFITWIYLQFAYPPEQSHIPGGEQLIKDSLDGMGKMSAAEWKTLWIFLGVVFLWVTGDWIGVDSTTACMLGACLLFFPKIGVINWSEANKGVSWQVLFICGGGVSMGAILMKTGAAEWISMLIFNHLGLSTLSTIALLIVVLIVVQYMHIFFVGTTAMAAAMLPVLIGIAHAAGLPPAMLALSGGMIIGAYPLLMFYNTIPGVLVFGTGKVAINDYPRVGIVLCAIACLIYALCALYYWPMLGVF